MSDARTARELAELRDRVEALEALVRKAHPNYVKRYVDGAAARRQTAQERVVAANAAYSKRSRKRILRSGRTAPQVRPQPDMKAGHRRTQPTQPTAAELLLAQKTAELQADVALKTELALGAGDQVDELAGEGAPSTETVDAAATTQLEVGDAVDQDEQSEADQVAGDETTEDDDEA